MAVELLECLVEASQDGIMIRKLQSDTESVDMGQNQTDGNRLCTRQSVFGTLSELQHPH